MNYDRWLILLVVCTMRNAQRIQFNSGIRAIVILVGELMHTPICADSRMLHKMVKYAQIAVATRFICH